MTIEALVDAALSRLSDDERRVYLAGLAHAYTAVMGAFEAEFDGSAPLDVSAVFARVVEQWRYVEVFAAVEGWA